MVQPLRFENVDDMHDKFRVCPTGLSVSVRTWNSPAYQNLAHTTDVFPVRTRLGECTSGEGRQWVSMYLASGLSDWGISALIESWLGMSIAIIVIEGSECGSHKQHDIERVVTYMAILG